MYFSRASLVFLFAVGLVGCQNDSIQTYVAPKDAPSPVGISTSRGETSSDVAVPGAPESARAQIRWTTPAGWQEGPSSTMRVGSFLIKGSNGQTADVSVVPLSGEAGGDLPNINRWRGQLRLTPWSDTDLDAQTRMITAHGRAMRWVDFPSEKPLEGAGTRRRITAAIYKSNGQTWFFKMTGDDATVRAAQASFRAFLGSLEFKPHA